MQDKKIKLAMVQMGAAEGNAEYNMNKIRSIIRAQKGKGTDIICFPELCVRGYDFEKTRTVPIDEKAFFADPGTEQDTGCERRPVAYLSKCMAASVSGILVNYACVKSGRKPTICSGSE